MLLLAVNLERMRCHIFSGLMCGFPDVLMTADQVGASHILSRYWNSILHEKPTHISLSALSYSRIVCFVLFFKSCYRYTVSHDNTSHISLQQG